MNEENDEKISVKVEVEEKVEEQEVSQQHAKDKEYVETRSLGHRTTSSIQVNSKGSKIGQENTIETKSNCSQDEESKECQKTETSSDQNQKLSKNQIRKKRRLEKMKESAAQRKKQKKEARYAKALAEGRDIEQENREQERRTQLGEGSKRRLLAEKKRFGNANNSFGVCLDCSYEDQMTEKEISSLALQIRYCYASNKRSKNPCRLFISSLSGKTYDFLSKVNGFPQQWKERAFTNTEDHFTEYWKDSDSKKLVYLTSDSENVIETLDDDKIYIIGGIVDRNRLKQAAFKQAQLHAIPTAKLPISDYIKTNATKVLTCNHVFEILLKYKEYGNNWEKALMDVLPQRKGLSVVKETDAEGSKIQEDTKDEDKEVTNLVSNDPILKNALEASGSK